MMFIGLMYVKEYNLWLLLTFYVQSYISHRQIPFLKARIAVMIYDLSFVTIFQTQSTISINYILSNFKYDYIIKSTANSTGKHFLDFGVKKEYLRPYQRIRLMLETHNCIYKPILYVLQNDSIFVCSKLLSAHLQVSCNVLFIVFIY